MYLKALQNQEQSKFKTRTMKEITKIRAEMNKIDNHVRKQ